MSKVPLSVLFVMPVREEDKSAIIFMISDRFKQPLLLFGTFASGMKASRQRRRVTHEARFFTLKSLRFEFVRNIKLSCHKKR